MRIKVKYCSIVDVEAVEPKEGKEGNRMVTLQMDEKDFFEVLDRINPKEIVKYLDMRFINHREQPVINIYECNKQSLSERNRRKLDRCLKILDSMRENEKL